jgi:hypothetical protein
MSLEDKSFYIARELSPDIFGSRKMVISTDLQVIPFEDVKAFQSNLEKLYEFIVEGTKQSSYEVAKAAFATMKYRFEILFPELVSEK